MIKKHFERLPTNVTPKHYTISLTTVLEQFTFEGQAIIKVVVNEETDNIKLNASELRLSKVNFESANQQLKTTKITVNSNDETVDILFESPLQVGEGMLLFLKRNLFC